ncbi:hypothetical protein RvY_01552-2 [Ramazzottius varieornatus]|uniref:Uncharacterized protein n=1 Tax=Ramazzottius varieornatus TaxID=947166 RepID=A0A1D1UH13_RAMVA|nr:hypothetical protein RvY_01552-2 [Ramazzottius varieornatus]
MRLLNTSMDTDGKFTCSGRNLALKATNRTFSLRTGVSFIDENGVRQLDTAVYRFSLTTNSMQVVGFFDLSSRLLLWDSNVTADWPNGIIPVDMPPCGFAGLSEACIPTNHSWVDDLKVAFPIVASFAVLLLMTSVWYQHKYAESLKAIRLCTCAAVVRSFRNRVLLLFLLLVIPAANMRRKVGFSILPS